METSKLIIIDNAVLVYYMRLVGSETFFNKNTSQKT